MSIGIIVRIDWNENKWEMPSDNLELADNFEYVRDNNISYTCFNFAHDDFTFTNEAKELIIPSVTTKKK